MSPPAAPGLPLLPRPVGFLPSKSLLSVAPAGVMPPETSDVVAEVGDPHAERVFDHHNLTGAAQHAADVDIDVLASRPRSADHATFFQLQHLARGHDAAVKLDF